MAAEGELVLAPVVVAEVAPIAALVASEEVRGGLADALKRLKGFP